MKTWLEKQYGLDLPKIPEKLKKRHWRERMVAKGSTRIKKPGRFSSQTPQQMRNIRRFVRSQTGDPPW